MTTKNLTLLILFLSIVSVNADQGQGRNDTLIFSIEKKIETTGIKNQYKSNTCWSYSLLGLLESEIIKNGKGNISLSEMFIVYYSYIAKAEQFVRMHGKTNFTDGGALNDPLNVIAERGIVPEESYTGLAPGATNHDHIALNAELREYIFDVVDSKTLNPQWKDGFISILNKYLGVPPTEFQYKGKKYTPKSFCAEMGINADNYIMLASFMYKPYYCRFIIEVPDNWSLGMAYNLPLVELMKTIDYSLEQGFPVAITGDITEKGFRWDKGLAILSNSDSLVLNPVSTKITPEMRQNAFDMYETTDDHGMLITGYGKDQFGNKHYLVKNSWGTAGTEHSGFIYMSDEYLQYKFISVVINKNLLIKETAKKLDPCCVK